MNDRPRLIVIAGPNGSGKTAITEQLRVHTWMRGCIYVNPDVIAFRQFGDWNSPEASLRAAQEAQKLREECVAIRKDLAFETVFSAPDKVAFVREAMARGYFVRLFFICTDNPDINAARIISRGKIGGHSVPYEKIVSRFQKSITQGAQIIPLVDRAYIYDNSVEGVAPKILFRAENGQLKKRYGEINPWAQPIFDALPQG